MLYMPDAIKATIDITEAPSQDIKIRSSYNLAGFSFTPNELAQLIAKRVSGFEISYDIDFRQQIAESWPGSIDDSEARKHWGWNNSYSINDMVDDMLTNLSKQ
jgi:nucleoside-diphosphate-sugar epimerase